MPQTSSPQTSSLTREQREIFDRVGVLCLPGFYSGAAIAAMADSLWTDLQSRFGIVRDRPETWTKPRPTGFQAVERAGAFAALGSPELLALIDDLLGAGAWERPRRWGQPLITFPSPAWDLPRVMWHLDYPGADHRPQLTALKLFTFLEPLRPHGGGTLYVAGSHRLAMEMAAGERRPTPSAVVRERLKADHPWFARLWAAQGDAGVRALIGAPAQVGGVEVQVLEMTGAPGDLILMHPVTLHGLSHNALDRPRMMLTQALSRRG